MVLRYNWTFFGHTLHSKQILRWEIILSPFLVFQWYKRFIFGMIKKVGTWKTSKSGIKNILDINILTLDLYLFYLWPRSHAILWKYLAEHRNYNFPEIAVKIWHGNQQFEELKHICKALIFFTYDFNTI